MQTLRYFINGKRKINLRPFGDLQFGTAGFQGRLFDRWMNETIEDPDAYAIGMGDYSDSFRPTIQKRLKSAFIDDDSAHEQLDDMLLRQTQNIADKLKPIRSKIIGLSEGHHFFKLNHGDMTTTQYLCQLLKVKYLGFVSGIQLIMRHPLINSKAINIAVTHGCGGSKYSYSDAAKLERDIMPFFDADIFLRGHSTKVYTMPGSPIWRYSMNRLGNNNLKLFKENRLLVNTGGFMEGYVEGKSSYVEEKGLPSCALGYAVIEIIVAQREEFGERRWVIDMRPTITTQ